MAFAMLLAALLLFASMNRNDEENSSSKYSTITSTIKNSFTELLFKPDHLNNAQPIEEVSNTLNEKQSYDALKQAIELALNGLMEHQVYFWLIFKWKHSIEHVCWLM